MKKGIALFLLLLFACKDKSKSIEPVAIILPNSEKCLIQLINYYQNGVKFENYYQKYIYNEQRYLIKEINVADCPNEKCYSTFEYDNLGNKLKKNIYKNNLLSTAEQYTYDKSGNMIKVAYLNAKNEEQSSFIYEYNSAKKITILKYYLKSLLQKTTKYSYDPNNNLIEAIYDASNKITHKYDKNNNLLNETIFINDIAENETNYKYDLKNREIEKKTTNSKLGTTFESETSYSDSERLSTSRTIVYEKGKPVEQIIKKFFDDKNREIKYQVFYTNNFMYSEKNTKYNSDGYIIYYEQYYTLDNSKNATEYNYICN